MLTEILLGLCALVSLYLSYRYAVGRPEGFPPGPPKIPVFGSYIFMMLSDFHFMHRAVLNFSKWYKSDIVGFYVGPASVVAVHNSQCVKKILNNPDFDGRPNVYLAQIRDPRVEAAGIFFKDGDFWKDQRWFLLRYLRDYGFGRRFDSLEHVITGEIVEMLDLIRNGPKYEHEKEFVKEGGYRILLPQFFNPFSLNSLFYCVLNDSKTRSEKAELFKLVQMGLQFQRCSDDYGKVLSIIPWVRHIFPNWSSYNQLMESNRYIYRFYEKIIDHHIATYDESSERNFIDLYIKEMRKAAKEGDTNSSFSREQFIMAVVDFTFPAFTALGAQMALLIQCLMSRPDVLTRIQKEIDDVIGDGRLPNLEDRTKLHYTEAAIRESLRYESLVPSNVPHKALVDTELMGYKIPKDTIIIPSLYALHQDKDLWDDPQNFRPERFLDEKGKFSIRKDISIPFGAGKRLCAGETFARNMLFLMTSAICQNFNIVLAPGDKIADPNTHLSGFIITPKDVWAQLEERVH